MVAESATDETHGTYGTYGKEEETQGAAARRHEGDDRNANDPLRRQESSTHPAHPAHEGHLRRSSMDSLDLEEIKLGKGSALRMLGLW